MKLWPLYRQYFQKYDKLFNMTRMLFADVSIFSDYPWAWSIYLDWAIKVNHSTNARSSFVFSYLTNTLVIRINIRMYYSKIEPIGMFVKTLRFVQNIQFDWSCILMIKTDSFDTLVSRLLNMKKLNCIQIGRYF